MCICYLPAAVVEVWSLFSFLNYVLLNVILVYYLNDGSSITTCSDLCTKELLVMMMSHHLVSFCCVHPLTTW